MHTFIGVLLVRRRVSSIGDGERPVDTDSSKHCACRMLLREIFQCEFAADFQVKLSAASMD